MTAPLPVAPRLGMKEIALFGNAIHLPLVSALVECSDSAADSAPILSALKSQSYPRLEIVVLDNLTDEESAKLNGAFGNDPRFRFLRNESNLETAIATCTGPFIAIAEAAPLPGTLSRHMQAHLAAKDPVAVTFEGNLANGAKTGALLAATHALRLGEVGDNEYSRLQQSSLHDPFDIPWLQKDSHFSVCRKVALGLLLPEASAHRGHLKLNAFLLPLCHFVGGSIALPSENGASGSPDSPHTGLRSAQLATLCGGAARLATVATMRYWSGIIALMRGNDVNQYAAFREESARNAVARELPALLNHFGARRLVYSLILAAGYHSASAIFMKNPRALSPGLLYALARAHIQFMIRRAFPKSRWGKLTP